MTEGRASALARLGLGLLMAAAALGLASAAVYKYQTLQSDWAFDLAFFHTLIYNAAGGDGFRQTASIHELDGLRYLSHGFFILPAFVPAYALWPHLETLLILQAAALASGAWPAAQICRSAGGSWPVALIAALTYLLSFPLWRLGLADFRPLVLAAPGLLWLGMALVQRRPLAVALATLVACACREEIPLVVIALTMGLWMGQRTDRRSALIALSLATAYFALLVGYRPRMDYYVPFSRPGLIAEGLRAGLPEGVPWERPLSHLRAYLPLAALPALLAPFALLGALPLLVYLLVLSPYEWWQWEGAYVHHPGPLLGVVMVAAALGLGRLEALIIDRLGGGAIPWARALLALALCGALVAEAVETRAGVEGDLGLRDGDQAKIRRAAALAEIVPLMASIGPEEAVVTDFSLIAALSGRRVLYSYQGPFGPGAQEGGIGRPVPTLGDVDVALVFMGHPDFMASVEASGGFERAGQGAGYVLYRRRNPR